MEFGFSPKVEDLRQSLLDFMENSVYPAERTYSDQLRASGGGGSYPSIMDELKGEAQRRGLWNLFMPDPKWGAGLTNVEYAPLAEITGRSPDIAPEALNCSAPDTGNMEILAEFGTHDQQERWLQPLLSGQVRSCFSMTEPAVASSDARNIQGRISRDGTEYVINARKWWSSGALDPRCEVAIVMGVTDADAEPYRQQSMVLVPLDTPGVRIVRSLSIFGYDEDRDAEIEYDDVRVPASNLLGGEGDGFGIAQARLGPGRIHHCMRALGTAERAYDLMCSRALTRVAFGKPLADQGVVQREIARSRIEIEQARLLTLKAAWLMDTVGKEGARIEISAIKAAVPRVVLRVLDRAIQIHGAAGVSQDFPLAAMYAQTRTLRIADGPDEVHEMVIARRELARYATAGRGE